MPPIATFSGGSPRRSSPRGSPRRPSPRLGTGEQIWISAYRNEVGKLEQGLEKAEPEGLNHIGMRTWTPIYAAASKGHREVMKLLLNSGADPNIRTQAGWSPLMAVAQSGDLGLVNMLLHYGATPHNEPSEAQARSALTVAIASENHDCAAAITGVTPRLVTVPSSSISHPFSPIGALFTANGRSAIHFFTSLTYLQERGRCTRLSSVCRMSSMSKTRHEQLAPSCLPSRRRQLSGWLDSCQQPGSRC